MMGKVFIALTHYIFYFSIDIFYRFFLILNFFNTYFL